MIPLLVCGGKSIEENYFHKHNRISCDTARTQYWERKTPDIKWKIYDVIKSDHSWYSRHITSESLFLFIQYNIWKLDFLIMPMPWDILSCLAVGEKKWMKMILNNKKIFFSTASIVNTLKDHVAKHQEGVPLKALFVVI